MTLDGRYALPVVMRQYVRRPIEERFFEKVSPEPNSGCWLWIAATSRFGYGKIGHPDSRTPLDAHRVSWTIHHGPIPPGLEVMHRCDVPQCVNPDHLTLGTHADNMADASQKGRMKNKKDLTLVQGEKNARAILTERDVLSIRKRAATGIYGIRCSLAREYGVSSATIYHIVDRTIWKHLP